MSELKRKLAQIPSLVSEKVRIIKLLGDQVANLEVNFLNPEKPTEWSELMNMDDDRISMLWYEQFKKAESMRQLLLGRREKNSFLISQASISWLQARTPVSADHAKKELMQQSYLIGQPRIPGENPSSFKAPSDELREASLNRFIVNLEKIGNDVEDWTSSMISPEPIRDTSINLSLKDPLASSTPNRPSLIVKDRKGVPSKKKSPKFCQRRKSGLSKRIDNSLDLFDTTRDSTIDAVVIDENIEDDEWTDAQRVRITPTKLTFTPTPPGQDHNISKSKVRKCFCYMCFPPREGGQSKCMYK